MALIFLLPLPCIAKVPAVVTSIAPIHSLVSQVMLGLGEPVLLLKAGQSPHAQSLKPSAFSLLENADVIVRIGPDFEIGMQKAIQNMARPNRVINLIQLPEMHLLDNRRSGVWAGDQQHAARHNAPEHLQVDPHLWLSTHNAIVIVKTIQSHLSQFDPNNSNKYFNNARHTIDNIQQLSKNTKLKLQAVKGKPYMVFHDAYQYFEQAFALEAVGAVTLSPEKKPGAKTLKAIQQTIQTQNVSCLFHEPQFQPKLVRRIAEASKIKTGMLDPIGASLASGPKQWFKLMNNLADNLLACIDPLP